MFTGIVEEIGKIEKVNPIQNGYSISIRSSKIIDDLSINDSVCIDGVCLTVTKIDKPFFITDAVGVTLEKTTFKNLKANSPVNLERAIKLSDRLGGHIVQGHVNGIGSISEIKKLGENYLFKVVIPQQLEKYLIKEGSIAVNGISLTIADLNNNEISISVIPHTWQNTNFKDKKLNDEVNIEIDILAKYVEKLLNNKDTGEVEYKLTESWLKELGY